jgi:multicomponent Na+:H+ antiporter subunit F
MTLIDICFVLLTLSLAAAAFRLCAGPTMADRVLAIDLMAVVVAAAVLVHAVSARRVVFLDVVVVLGVIVFFGTVAVAGALRGKS